MQSSIAVAGMDALSYPSENILTRRANQWHYSFIAPFAKRPWPCPTTGSCSAIAGKKSLPTIEVAPARRSCTGSPKLHRLAEVASARHSEGSPLALPSRARFPMREPEDLESQMIHMIQELFGQTLREDRGSQ